MLGKVIDSKEEGTQQDLKQYAKIMFGNTRSMPLLMMTTSTENFI